MKQDDRASDDSWTRLKLRHFLLIPPYGVVGRAGWGETWRDGRDDEILNPK